MATKTATIIAVAVEVLCPHCGEGVPDPENGSFMWEVHQMRQANGRKVVCDSCESSFVIHSLSRVLVAR